MKFCPQCANGLLPESIDGITRLQCNDCGYTFWNNPTPVVAGLVLHNDRVVLARNAGWPKKLYSVITGYLEEGEEPCSGIVREVKEELGLEARQSSFIGHYMFKEKNQLIIAYAINATGSIALNEELVDTRLLSFDALKQYDFSPLYVTQAIVNDWLKRK